jgi:hypothetical protein
VAVSQSRSFPEVRATGEPTHFSFGGGEGASTRKMTWPDDPSVLYGGARWAHALQDFDRGSRSRMILRSGTPHDRECVEGRHTQSKYDMGHNTVQHIRVKTAKSGAPLGGHFLTGRRATVRLAGAPDFTFPSRPRPPGHNMKWIATPPTTVAGCCRGGHGCPLFLWGGTPPSQARESRPVKLSESELTPRIT